MKIPCAEHPRPACGPLAYDPADKQFTLGHEALPLTPCEQAALRALIQHNGEPLCKQEILERVFAAERHVGPEAVEALVQERLQVRGCRFPLAGIA